jgi:AraC-like DNA-binding protein
MNVSTRTGGGKSRIPWHLVNWDVQDIELAEQYGCSRERVRQKRKELGVGKPKKWHCRRGSAREKIEGLKDTSKMTLKEVATAVGCSSSYALQTLKKLGLTYKRQPLGGRPKYDWDKADWSKGYREIADDLGIDNPGVVSQYRQRHGFRAERETAADRIREALVDGPVEPKEAATIGGCTERYAKEVLKRESVESVVTH